MVLSPEMNNVETKQRSRGTAAGMGLCVAGTGVLIGLSAGLSNSVGIGGAIGIGIGASSGLYIAGIRKMRKAGSMECAEKEKQAEAEKVTSSDV